MRDYGEAYIANYKPDLQKIKLIRAMRVCKTPTLGGKAIVCKSCNHHHYLYFSCGHSHCPICQSIKREQWIDKLKSQLYNVPYVHIVFTLPHELNGLARNNKSKMYSLLMRSSWKTIKVLCSKEENVGGLPGMISVLHTFGSDMKYHIHTHTLVTFGGVLVNGDWVYPNRKDKIAPYRRINATYKSIFLQGLKKLYESGDIEYKLSYQEIRDLVSIKTWVVHNTKPTLDTSILENYLARYINRVAVSNSRVQYLNEHQKVKLLYKDYKNQIEGQPAPEKTIKQDPLSFIHQMMQHVLPSYFQKSRRYGIHAGATKRKYEEVISDSIKRNGFTIRTLMQIITQLIKDKPYQCEKCNFEEYEVELVYPDKEWVKKYINLPHQKPTFPFARSPPNKARILW